MVVVAKAVGTAGVANDFFSYSVACSKVAARSAFLWPSCLFSCNCLLSLLSCNCQNVAANFSLATVKIWLPASLLQLSKFGCQPSLLQLSKIWLPTFSLATVQNCAANFSLLQLSKILAANFSFVQLFAEPYFVSLVQEVVGFLYFFQLFSLSAVLNFRLQEVVGFFQDERLL